MHCAVIYLYLLLFCPQFYQLSLLYDGGNGTIYAGSVLTLTCSIVLPSEVSGIINDLTVTSSWTEQGGGEVMGSRVTIPPPTS